MSRYESVGEINSGEAQAPTEERNKPNARAYVRVYVRKRLEREEKSLPEMCRRLQNRLTILKNRYITQRRRKVATIGHHGRLEEPFPAEKRVAFLVLATRETDGERQLPRRIPGDTFPSASFSASTDIAPVAATTSRFTRSKCAAPWRSTVLKLGNRPLTFKISPRIGSIRSRILTRRLTTLFLLLF